MKTHRLAALAAAASVLAGCGGDGGGSGGDASTPPPGATLYPEVSPPAGSVNTFATTSIDDANNTVNNGYEERVTAVGTDGSYQLSQDDPTNASFTVNGITYHFNPVVRQYGATAANNQESGYTATEPDGSTVACSVALNSGGHPRPWYVGQTWTTHYTVTCGSSSTSYTDTGSVESVESVTVPAGTFTALKNRYSESWTTHTGEHITEQGEVWVDPAYGFFTLKRTLAFQRSGTLPAHFVNSETVTLQSRH